MNDQYNGKLTPNAKKLRKTMTKEERHLWYDCLKLLPITVHRQKILGNYIVDFYIASARIVIELDGSQHLKIQTRKKMLYVMPTYRVWAALFCVMPIQM